MLRSLLPLLGLLYLSSAAATNSPLPLSTEEQAWLDQHPVIHLGIDPDWPPFEYFDDQQHYKGIAADYIALISKKLNIRMEAVPDLTWSGVLQQAEAKQLDVLPAAMSSPQRRQYLQFTNPYLNFPMVIITRDDAPFISSLEALSGRRVAVVTGYVSHEILQAKHPELSLVPIATLDASLKSLSNGEIDAFVGNLASVTHAIQALGLTNLKVAAHTPYSFELGMGVRNDWPELTAILNKALNSISEEERVAIQRKWVGVRFEQGVDPVTVALVGGPLLLASVIVLFVVTSSNRRLRREVSERIEVERQLRLSEEALNESQRTAKIGWWRWDLGNNTLMWSDEVYLITGKQRDDFIPTPENFMSVVHPDDLPQLSVEIQNTLQGLQDKYDLEFRVIREDGSLRYVHSYGKIYGSSIDEARYFAGVLHDITERKSLDLALAEERKTLQTLLDNAPLGIWLQDTEGKLRFVNQAFCNAVGISEERFLSVPHYAELYPTEVAARCVSSDMEALAEDGPHTSYEQLEFVDGKLHDLEIIKARLTDDKGEINGLIGLSMDITERKQAEEQLRKQAYYDVLTALPNRNYFMEQLDKTLALSKRHNYYSALLFFDLDNFKMINDTLGHHTGDKLLMEVGQRLKLVIRQEDTAARLGGDEFVIIATNLGNDPEFAAEQARFIAEKVHTTLSMPISLEGREHHLTLSTGISLFPIGDHDSNDILKFADTAMYRAKDGGRDGLRFFQPGMQKAAEERFELQGKLRQALANQELELFYQPQHTTDGAIIGFESLLRWQHAELGMVPPSRFIPLAEESGLIVDIGSWVLHQACTQAVEWSRNGTDVGTIAVNVSPRQFHQPDFVAQVITTVRNTGIEPSCLELELTEGILVENINEVSSKMGQLQREGIRFAIDDFGTGYSSLRYLKQLPLDRLKIDQSFVRDIHHSDTNAHIVDTIISMARHLELELIAEGVETIEELNFLTQRGCDKFQGYYFSKPQAARDLQLAK